jgi:hypothetical protein
MRLTAVALLVSGAAIAGCAAAQPPDVLQSAAVCDSVPEPLGTGAVPRGVLPSRDSTPERASVVLGVVTEMGSGRPLRSAGVALFRVSTASRRDPVGQEVPTDSAGGFVLGPVPPGAYTLRVRALRHRVDERPVVLRAGAADTVRVEMRYLRCAGY